MGYGRRRPASEGTLSSTITLEGETIAVDSLEWARSSAAEYGRVNA